MSDKSKFVTGAVVGACIVVAWNVAFWLSLPTSNNAEYIGLYVADNGLPGVILVISTTIIGMMIGGMSNVLMNNRIIAKV